MSDNFFGGMFDFDGDGHTDAMEEATGLAVIHELTKDEEQDDSDYDDDYDIAMDDYDTDTKDYSGYNSTEKNNNPNTTKIFGIVTDSPAFLITILILIIVMWAFIIGVVLKSCSPKPSYTYKSSHYYGGYSSNSYLSNNSYTSKSYSGYNSGSYSTNKSYSSKSSGDLYNAKGYDHADDFYYDYYDDFSDYEEAEDYFNEHSDD
jgi:hypothetical protein